MLLTISQTRSDYYCTEQQDEREVRVRDGSQGRGRGGVGGGHQARVRVYRNTV